jgi:hypothetical protein
MYEMYMYGEEWAEPDSTPPDARAALQEALDRRDNGGDPRMASKVAAWQR